MEIQKTEEELKQDVITLSKSYLEMMECGEPIDKCRAKFERCVDANRQLAAMRAHVALQNQK